MKTFENIKFRDVLIDAEGGLNLVGKDGDGKLWLATRTWLEEGIVLGNSWSPLSKFDPSGFTKLEIQVEYTGGGVWLALAWLDSRYYAMVSRNDGFDDCFTVFDKLGEDDCIEFPCYDIVGSHNIEDLEEGSPYWMLFNLMSAKLDNEAF